MSYLCGSKSLIRSSLLLLSTVSLSACSAVEFERDPGNGVGGKAGTLTSNSSGTPGGTGGASTSEGTPAIGGTSAAGGVGTSGSATGTSGGVAGASTTGTLPPAFETFHLRRAPSFGFCIEPGQAQDVSFTRGTDGALTLAGTVVRSVKDPYGMGDPDLVCPTGTTALFEEVCAATTPAFQPTLAEQAHLESLIASLPVGKCALAPGRLCDYCSDTTYDIDARVERDYCCGEQQAVGFDDAFIAIGAFVDHLVSRAETHHESIRLRRAQGMMGFCAKEGESVDVTLQRGVDGTFALAGTYVKKLVNNRTGCPAATEPITSSSGQRHCIGTLASVALSGSETARLDGLLASLPDGECNRDENRACDFCSVPTLEFAGTTESSSCCGTLEPVEFSGRFSAITGYIDELVLKYAP